MKALGLCLGLLFGGAHALLAADLSQSLVAPKTGTIKVAFVLGEGAHHAPHRLAVETDSRRRHSGDRLLHPSQRLFDIGLFPD